MPSLYLLIVLDKNLNDNIRELDVHDGFHRLLLWTHQCRSKAHPEVGHCHQVRLCLISDPSLEEGRRK